MSIVRVRQHVNPLNQKYQQPIDPPDWATVYAQIQPLHLDIGCGRGQFLLEMAQQQTDRNFLGLEIREPLVIQATAAREASSLSNLHYLFCNANNSLQPLLGSYSGRLDRVTLQFPDPWFKKRHQKRRVVQPSLVNILAAHLISGGWVFLQSDIEEVAVAMVDRFAAHPAFIQQTPAWISTNPLPIATERERSVLSESKAVYRSIFVRQ